MTQRLPIPGQDGDTWGESNSGMDTIFAGAVAAGYTLNWVTWTSLKTGDSNATLANLEALI